MHGSGYEQITYERRDAVALITLHRPDKLNAWTGRMHHELTDAVHTANDDPSIGAMVFTGAGRGFCAGADIGGQFKSQLDGDKEPQTGAPAARDGSDGDGQATDWVALCRASKPMIAAVNGAAIGIGLTLILPMDQLIAGESAKLSCRFVKMGLTPELASSHFLVQRCGWGAASDLTLSGRIVPAADAARVGLVDRVVPDGELLDTALALAGEYAANPTPQLRMIKGLLSANAVETDLDAVLRREADALSVAYRTPEHREAVDAFLTKREPKFR